MALIKFLLTFLAVIILLRFALRMLAGAVQIKIVKNYYTGPGEEQKKREGEVTVLNKAEQNAKPRYSSAEGEYVNYEEVK